MLRGYKNWFWVILINVVLRVGDRMVIFFFVFIRLY